jgi:hypothetical protein
LLHLNDATGAQSDQTRFRVNFRSQDQSQINHSPFLIHQLASDEPASTPSVEVMFSDATFCLLYIRLLPERHPSILSAGGHVLEVSFSVGCFLGSVQRVFLTPRWEVFLYVVIST